MLHPSYVRSSVLYDHKIVVTNYVLLQRYWVNCILRLFDRCFSTDNISKDFNLLVKVNCSHRTNHSSVDQQSPRLGVTLLLDGRIFVRADEYSSVL